MGGFNCGQQIGGAERCHQRSSTTVRPVIRERVFALVGASPVDSNGAAISRREPLVFFSILPVRRVDGDVELEPLADEVQHFAL